MSIKDSLRKFSKEVFEVCYIVKFQNNKVEINKYPDLKKEIKWAKKGENSYYAYCGLSKDKLVELICKITNISSSDITVVNSSELSGMGFA